MPLERVTDRIVRLHFFEFERASPRQMYLPSLVDKPCVNGPAISSYFNSLKELSTADRDKH